MFRFLTDWWARRRAGRRHVFGYRSSGKMVWRDPLVIVRKMEAAEPNWETLLGTVGHVIPADADFILRAAAEEKRKAATARLVEIGRAAFDLAPLADDGVGTTEAEVVGVLVSFVGFMNRLMEDARPFGSRPGQPASAANAG